MATYMIRELHQDDILTIVAQEQEVFGYSLGESHYTKGFELKASFGFVYEKEMIQGAILGWQNEHYAQIDNLYVVPISQQQGIGRQLLEAFIQAVTKRGITEVSLEVAVTNEVAIQLYQRFGFRIKKEIKHYFPDQSSAYRMIYERGRE